MSGTLKVGGKTLATHDTNTNVAKIQLGSTSDVVLTDSAGNNVLSESGSVVTLSADEANVGSNALVVNSSGNVGIGVTPNVWLSGSSYSVLQMLGISIFGNSSSGGGLIDGNSYLDGTGTPRYLQSTLATRYNNQGGAHVWYTAPSGTAGDPVSFSERMRIDSSGRVLVGTSPYNDVTNGGFHFFPNYDGTNSSTIEIGHISGSSSGFRYAVFKYDGSNIGSITQNGTTSVAYNTSSDYRLKENITEITDGINRVKQLNPSRFNFIADPDKIVDGFIAHEIQGIVPEAVSGEKDAVDLDGNPKYQGVDYGRITPLLTAALKEAIEKIEMLEARIAVLEAK